MLFVSADSFVQQLNATAQEEENIDNFDFEIAVISQARIERLRAHPALKESSLVAHEWAQALIPEEDFTKAYPSAWEASAKHRHMPIRAKQVHIVYLEDNVRAHFSAIKALTQLPIWMPTLLWHW